MKLISHRGNIDGKNIEQENTVEQINYALDLGYDVEVDVWYKNKKWYLGHDNPRTQISISYLSNPKLWIHAKNIPALHLLKDTTNCFMHDTDHAVLTSKNYIWTYPGRPLVKNSIAVLPERCNYSWNELSSCYGICSDYISRYKEIND